MARLEKPQFGIVPGVEQQGFGGEAVLVADHLNARQGVYIFGYAHRCEGATQASGDSRYHAVVEFWDVRDRNAPFFITILHPASEEADEHYSYFSAATKVREIIDIFAEEFADPDLPVGSALRSLIIADFGQFARGARGQAFAAVLNALLEDDDSADNGPFDLGKTRFVQ